MKKTGESIFLTANHVFEDGRPQFHMKQPVSGLDVVINSDQMTMAHSSEGFFNDVAVIKLPFIPAGVQAFSFSGSGLCVSEQPVENSTLRAFAFPYMNKSEGGIGFTQFLSEGVVESVGNPGVNMTTCWYENASKLLFIPTTMPTRPGTSGALVLDQNNQGVGLMKALSPHGAVILPINPELIKSLIAQTGFVPKP